jgi:hypothetical protein
LWAQIQASEHDMIGNVTTVARMQRHCNYAVAICLGAYGMMVSTTLGRSAIHAADHLPDLELGPCAAAAAHRWDHPEDHAAVQ